MGVFKQIFFVFTVGVIIIAIGFKLYFNPQLAPMLSTSGGNIQGIILKSRGGKEFVAYLGIPYAKPPIGKLRFQSPIKAKKWDGVWDGTYYRSFCTQFDFMVTGFSTGSEDCLYLNVFVPNVSSNEGLPILAHMHGGYFHTGRTEFHGPHYFMDHDVVVVTLTYRLGALGFLNTGDGVVRGNMGLKDQQLALKWIQDNIKNFGGDPRRVTILGESAGAASVQYHMLSPTSAGLFSKAIRQSGSSLNYWTLRRENTKEQARTFAKKFNCPVDESEKMVECLREIDAKVIATGHRDLKVHPIPQDSKFVPSIEVLQDDDAFLIEEPLQLIKSGKFNKVPVLSGYNADEGIVHTAFLSANDTKLNEAINDWFTWAPKALHYSPQRRDISKKIFDFYFAPYIHTYKSQRDWLQNFTNLFGDRLFNYGITQSALLERKYTPVYLYLYEHHGGFNLGTVIGWSQAYIHPILSAVGKLIEIFCLNQLLGIDLEHELPGTSHGDEIAMLWYSPLVAIFFSERKDLHLSKEIVKLWTDFASNKQPFKFGNVELNPCKENDTLKFIRMSLKDSTIVEEPNKNRRLFWDNLKI